MSILKRAAQLEEKNKSFAVVTIIESKGSTPRHTGKMIVYPDATIEGTIGGGPLELYAIEESVAAIQKARSQVLTYEMDGSASKGKAMYCGGRVKLFCEVHGTLPELCIIGAGHVAYALSQIADTLCYPYVVVDERSSYCNPERYPRAGGLFSAETIDEAVRQASPHEHSYVIICTADSDDAALREVLKYPVAYIGMIGSTSKREHVFKALRREGVDETLLRQVHTPMGLSISAETPEEIAVSIMAEIISIFRA